MLKGKIEAVLLTCPGSLNSPATSGMLWGKYVITSGAILMPFLRENNRIGTALRACSSGFHLADESLSALKFWIRRTAPNSGTNGRLLAFWKSDLVTDSLKKVFGDWTIMNGFSQESIENAELSMESSCIFVVLHSGHDPLTDKKKYSKKVNDVKRDIITSLIELYRKTMVPARGDVINVVSTPFGNEVFLNSLSSGIVSNIVGFHNCLILIDARTVPGCEGGPIFTSNKSRCLNSDPKLVGLVTCPLSWWRGEWVGLTIGITLAPVLRHLLCIKMEALDWVVEPFIRNSDLKIFPEGVETIEKIVVMVRCGNVWGSGIVMSANIVATCSHVLKSGGIVSVFRSNSCHKAWVIYKSPDDVAYDLAILRVRNIPSPRKLDICCKLPEIGDEVIAVGYPFFTEKDVTDLRATFVHGTVAKVHPHMIQSTCCVQSGFSGGALLKKGKLIGIIICNVKDSSSGAIYPRINFSVPSSVFQPIVTSYLKTGNIQALNALESKDGHVQALWSLGSSKL